MKTHLILLLIVLFGFSVTLRSQALWHKKHQALPYNEEMINHHLVSTDSSVLSVNGNQIINLGYDGTDFGTLQVRFGRINNIPPYSPSVRALAIGPSGRVYGAASESSLPTQMFTFDRPASAQIQAHAEFDYMDPEQIVVTTDGIIRQAQANYPDRYRYKSYVPGEDSTTLIQVFRNVEQVMTAGHVLRDSVYITCANDLNREGDILRGTIIIMDHKTPSQRNASFPNLALKNCAELPNGNILIVGHPRTSSHGNPNDLVFFEYDIEAMQPLTTRRFTFADSRAAHVELVIVDNKVFFAFDSESVIYVGCYDHVTGNLDWGRVTTGSFVNEIYAKTMVMGRDGFLYLSTRPQLLGFGQNSSVVYVQKISTEGDFPCATTVFCTTLESFDVMQSTGNLRFRIERNPIGPVVNSLIGTPNSGIIDFCSSEEPLTADAAFSIPEAVCLNECFQILDSVVQTAGTYSWLLSADSYQELFSNETPDSICPLFTGALTLQHQVVLYGCQDSAEMSIEILELPSLVVRDTTLCNADSFLITAAVGNLEVFDASGTSVEPLLSESGSYTALAANEFCEVRDDFVVRFIADEDPESLRYFSEDILELCLNREIVLPIESVLNPSINWETITDLPSTETPTVLTLHLSGNIDHCPFRDSLLLSIIDCSEPVYFPNAFSPNFDGINDVWRAYGNFFEGKSIKVFDRWGGIRHQAEGALEWDGKSDGKPVNQGVYVALVEYLDIGSLEIIQKAVEITVVR